MNYETKLIHGDIETHLPYNALSVPIVQSSTFSQDDIDNPGEYLYSRSENPTRQLLEKSFASLENAQFGYAFSSGMAAITSSLLAFLKTGDHIIATRDIYGGTYRFLTEYLPRIGVETTFIDITNPDLFETSLKKNTKIIYIETPSNPLLKITDIRKVSHFAKKNSLVSIIDNTFMSPYLQRPLDLGIDISVHSATKFIGGHSDVVAGLVATNNREYGKNIYFIQNGFGSILGPQDSFLLLRGIKTLKVRMDAQTNNAILIAEALNKHRSVKKVWYPGLEDHEGYTTHKAQSDGPGCLVSFELYGVETAKKLMNNVKVWKTAVSLGGVESILSYPYRMSHYAIPKEVRESLGVHDNLLRLSVGLENTEDLLEDIVSHI